MVSILQPERKYFLDTTPPRRARCGVVYRGNLSHKFISCIISLFSTENSGVTRLNVRRHLGVRGPSRDGSFLHFRFVTRVRPISVSSAYVLFTQSS